MSQVWEEVKQLAVDFQKAQLSSTSQRLSERNCVEIVSKLTALNLLDVVYTTDGKSYITPVHLAKEVKDELEIKGGRVSIAEASHTLGVDYSQIESKAHEISSNDPSIHIVLGQLINTSYLDRIAEEMNDKLQEKGQIKMGTMAKEYDLPTDFITSVIQQRLGTLIQGRCDTYDKHTVYTEGYVRRRKACIRGIFSAVTRPTPISQVLNQMDFQERLFFSLLEDLLSSGHLAGSVHGGKQTASAVYVPELYTRVQQNWLQDFYTQNGYLEFASLTRLGISDPRSYVTRRFPKAMVLHSCCVGDSLIVPVQDAVDESLAAGSYIDISTLLPAAVSAEDAAALASGMIKGRNSAYVMADCIIVSELYLSHCTERFKGSIEERAQQVARENPRAGSGVQTKAATKEVHVDYKEERREQRRKKAGSGKSGGGQQGRETKTKAVKKKYKTGRGVDDEETEDANAGPVQFMPVSEIEAVLQSADEECPEHLVAAVAECISRPLQQQFLASLQSVYLHAPGSSARDVRRSRQQLSEQIQSLAANAAMFEKALQHFTGDTVNQLEKHLLRTMCSDMVNLLVCSVAADQHIDVPDDSQLTPEARQKMLKQFHGEERTLLSKLHSTLSKSLPEYWEALEEACSADFLNIMIKKTDKKRERQLAFAHRQSLSDQIRAENEPAALLHLSVSLLFQTHTSCPLLSPGKLVPMVVAFLGPNISSESRRCIQRCQDLVMQQLRGAASEDDVTELQSLLPQLREVALSRKSDSASKE